MSSPRLLDQLKSRIRAVLYSAEKSIYGDDLSENQALRYGHVEATEGDHISKELAENIDIFYKSAIKQGQYKIATC